MAEMTTDPRDAHDRAHRQAETVRHEILAQATDLFSHYGFAKTNIGDIAERCAMSPGNLYRYYRNKQAIGLAVCERYFAMEQAGIETGLMLPGGTAEDRIRSFLVTGVSYLAREVEQHSKIVELAEFMCENEEGLEILARHIAWKRTRLAREIASGIADRQLAPCDPVKTAATMLNSLKMFFMPMTLIRWRDRSTILPELNDTLDLMFSGLRAR